MGSGGGAEDDAFGPSGGEAGVVVGVEVGKEVGDGGGGGVTEGVDEEAGFWDEFGGRESGGDGREMEGFWRGGLGGAGGEEEVG